MKIGSTIRGRRPGEGGNVMYVVLITAIILGTALASHLRLVSNQHRSVARSRAWNMAIPVAEAGIEEALAQIARSTNAAGLNANGWYQDGAAFVKKRQIDDDNFVTKIYPSNPPLIESHGFAEVPYSPGTMLERRVRVTTTNTSVFNHAMLAEDTIQLAGNNIKTDSFDSTDPNYSTGGMYDPLKRLDGGDIATNSGLTNSISAGNADIMGDVSTGYGGSVNIGANGVVGDEAWHLGGNTGIQPGMYSNDMNVDVPVMDAPFTSAVPPESGSIGSTSYTFLIPDGDYALGSLSLSSSNTVMVTGNVRLYVAGDISITGAAGIQIAPGASLTIYAAGATTKIGGSGIVNQTGLASSFSYVGLETNTKVQISGNADFTGTIYAPEAFVHLGGGGSTIYDFVGSVVAGSIMMNGSYNFHFDEALSKIPTPGHYTITSWNEF